MQNLRPRKEKTSVAYSKREWLTWSHQNQGNMARLTPVEANLYAQQFVGGLVCSRKTMNSCDFKGQH